MPSGAELARRLGLAFADLSLLDEALVHSSFRNEQANQAVVSNDRLEFLGDAVVALVISRELFARYPAEDEGALTARRAALVSTRGLARLAERIDLGRYIVLGQGAERQNERRRASVLAAGLEAVVGAIYLDLGLEAAGRWLLSLAEPELAADATLLALKSPKSRLQEYSYARGGAAPEYRLVDVAGPDHRRHFVVEAVVDGIVLGRGEGASRREAETQAAERGLLAVEGDSPGRIVPATGEPPA